MYTLFFFYLILPLFSQQFDKSTFNKNGCTLTGIFFLQFFQ